MYAYKHRQNNAQHRAAYMVSVTHTHTRVPFVQRERESARVRASERARKRERAGLWFAVNVFWMCIKINKNK